MRDWNKKFFIHSRNHSLLLPLQILRDSCTASNYTARSRPICFRNFRIVPTSLHRLRFVASFCFLIFTISLLLKYFSILYQNRGKFLSLISGFVTHFRLSGKGGKWEGSERGENMGESSGVRLGRGIVLYIPTRVYDPSIWPEYRSK